MIKFDMTLLHPKAVGAFTNLKERLYRDYRQGITKTYFAPFEGYRLPMEQKRLLIAKTTKAAPFQSAHNYGLAVDFVPMINGDWNWDDPANDWDHLDQVAALCGLRRPIHWDRPHIEHPLWEKVKAHLV